MFVTSVDSPIGRLTLACTADGTALTALWMAGQRFFGSGYTEERLRCDDVPLLKKARRWLERYFDGQRPNAAELPLAPIGTPFRQAVWHELRRIPYGEVTTYGAIAKAIARQRGLAGMSAQAVGGAVGHNPVSIIIPCHRVIGSNGNLTGYGGGMARKIALLSLEGVDVENLHLPQSKK